MFLAEMNYTDPIGDKSWSVRFGTNGAIYSHYTPHMWGETMPPQKHAESPWVDEVQQSVSVVGALNYNPSACYVHQAGKSCSRVRSMPNVCQSV